MSLEFEAYENQFNTTIRKAKYIMNNFQHGTEDQKKNNIPIVKDKIKEAELICKKLEAEYKGIQVTGKVFMKKKVDTALKEVEDAKKRILKLEEDYHYETNKANLMRQAKKDEKMTVKEKNERIQGQNKQLGELASTTHQTLDMTKEANKKLLEQRELLNKIETKNGAVGQDLNRVDDLTSTLRNAEYRNKAILWMTTALLGVTNISVGYMKVCALLAVL